ncbi:hypothetical protein ACLKA7_001038 [Drosophila subpalustris]
MSKRKRSNIWNHFIANEDGKTGKCIYCKSSLSIAGGSQGNLARHLKLKHPTVNLALDRQETIPSTADRQETVPSTADKPPAVESEQSTLVSVAGQQMITNFIRRPPTGRKIDQLDRQVLKMIAKGNHSFRIVEEPEFKTLIEMASQCPGYKLPQRKALSNTLLRNIYEEFREKVRESLSKAHAICLTTDSWTSRCNQSYIAVTAHYIEPEETILKSCLLECQENAERHTITNLCSFLKKTIGDWEMTNKVTAIVTDNAANILGAVNQGNWRSIACFAHTINLVVQSSLSSTESIISRSKSIVGYFHRSANGLKVLKETQQQLNLPLLKLKMDVQTRWNSTYDMLQRLITVKDALAIALPRLRPDLILLEREWKVVKELISVLKPFYEITCEISSEKNITLSKVTIFCKMLGLFLTTFSAVTEEVKEVVNSMQDQMASRLSSIEINELYAESTILDPRFKSRGFKNHGAFRDAVEILKRKLKSIHIVEPTEFQTTSPTAAQENTTGSSLWDSYDVESRTIVTSSNQTFASRLAQGI